MQVAHTSNSHQSLTQSSLYPLGQSPQAQRCLSDTQVVFAASILKMVYAAVEFEGAAGLARVHQQAREVATMVIAMTFADMERMVRHYPRVEDALVLLQQLRVA